MSKSSAFDSIDSLSNSYKQIACLTSDIIWEWDLLTGSIKRILGMSSAFGYYVDAMRDDEAWWYEHIHPRDRECVKKELTSALKNRNIDKWESEYRFYLEDGSTIWAYDRAYILRDKSGKAIKLFGSMIDITKRKENAEKLKIRLRLQRAISELGQEALSHVNLYVFLQNAAVQLSKILNVEFTKILELMPGGNEMVLRAGIGWNDNIVIHESTVETGPKSQGGYTLLSNKPVIVQDLRKETRFRGPNLLTEHNIVSGMSVILYGNSGIYGVLGIHTKKKRKFTQDDIDYLQSIANIISLAIQRHQTEEELRISQAHFKSLYDANIIGVMYEKIDGSILEVNSAFLQMIGYTRKEFEQKPLSWTDITPPEYHDADKKAVTQVLKKGIAYPYEKEYLRKDGTRVPAIVGAVMLNADKGEVMAFALDITERKELETKKDEFMSIASHELRTPLTSIKGYTQILERIIQQMGDPRLHTYLKKTNTYVDRLNSLIVELLDVSKIQAGKLVMNFERVDFDMFIKENIESAQHFSSKHSIVFHGRIDEVLLIDRNRLEQVFSNLITNAIKYSPNANKVEISVKKELHQVIVSIKDEGIGISRRDQKNLFNRFYRVESSSTNFSGLGIGLYISREIIKRHGGKIWVTSKKGEGSTFSFSLPLNPTLPQPHIV